ncbi:hypothetical protein RSOLAG22IIIB_12596 [Rhizoctonia solani]|uniref:Uncharacterized protein n=1 Tax=Rhizoctonia solani TaxID=456999 RepID=A0A0K6GF16_9AGAM|nr:hypothetical protein RSOLAG22IIIB_12596 [Rhizoctonia solani]
MFKFIAASLFAVASLVAAQANDPSINSPPSVVQCQPVQLSWTATKEPVYIAIIPGGQPGAAPLKDFGQQPPGTKTMTWKCDKKAGTSITFQIKDAAGAVAYSGNINVQGSSDSSCVKDDPAPPPPASSQAAPSASSGPASSPAGPRPDVIPTTSAAASSSHAAAAAPATSGSSTRAPAAATTATPASTGVAAANGALPGAQIGWTGLMGALAAFIVA